jgi:hypothetical protein
MTPQKFKPGDKVALTCDIYMYSYSPKTGRAVKTGPPTMRKNDIFTVARYGSFVFIQGMLFWEVYVEGHDAPCAEMDLAPVLPNETLAELIEESLGEKVKT